MLVYLRDGSAKTILRAATLRYKLQIKRSTSPSHSILTPGRPVPVLTLKRQAPGRVATGVSIFESLVWLDPEKIPAQAGFEPGIFRSRGGRLNYYANEAVQTSIEESRVELDTPSGSPTTTSPGRLWPRNPQGNGKRGNLRNTWRRDTVADMQCLCLLVA